jgi:hypothetical protein
MSAPNNEQLRSEHSRIILENALAAVRKGWKVFPCQGKLPHGLLAPNGFHSATSDESKVREWFDREHSLNYGIACAPSGLVVLDIDVRNGGTLAETLAHFDITSQQYEAGYVVESGGSAVAGERGRHIYVSNVAPSDKLKGHIDRLGIDIKANGYVLGAGSVHPETGDRYSVVCDGEPLWPSDDLWERLTDNRSVIAKAGAVYERQTFTVEDAQRQGRQVTLFKYLTSLRGLSLSLDDAGKLAVLKAEEIGYGDAPDHRETPTEMAVRVWGAYDTNERNDNSHPVSTDWADFEGGSLSEAEDYGDTMPNYIIHGLEPGEVGAIFAAVNVGKSTLSRNLALSLACGRSYLNLTQSGEPIRTLLLNFEGGRRRFYREIKSMASGLDNHEQSLTRKNFRFLLHDNPDHRIDGKRLDLKNSAHREWLTKHIKHHGFKFVVVDTITAAIQFKNENSNEEWQEYTKWLEDIAVETQACVLFIHHEGKRGLESTGQSAPRAHRGRGGSANSQLAQLVINLESREDRGSKYLVMGLGKLKDEPVNDLTVEHGLNRWLVPIGVENGSTPLQRPMADIDKVLAEIQRHPEDGITARDISLATDITKWRIHQVFCKICGSSGDCR